MTRNSVLPRNLSREDQGPTHTSGVWGSAGLRALGGPIDNRPGSYCSSLPRPVVQGPVDVTRFVPITVAGRLRILTGFPL